ncbi:MAG: class I SAM-dependent methyltransferase [Verrucomicrobia bacterium]|nr:class I SAM-dependent methyltransferase [Verrucomicrobiota bacterium]
MNPGPVPPLATPNQPHLPPHPELPEFYAMAEERSRFVQTLFDRTAEAYDRVSAAIAFGADRHYRRQALQQAGLRPGARLLDVATGTGLVLQAARELGLPMCDLVGVDPSRGMLAANHRRHPVALVQAFGERLPFAAGAFDFITMGYALRHVADLRQFFAELRRVLVPGGRVLLLEISRPESKLGRAMLRFHLLRVVPWLARPLSGRAEARQLLRYYWATIDQCAPPAAILEALAAAGFQEAHRRVCHRILSDYSAIKS